MIDVAVASMGERVAEIAAASRQTRTRSAPEEIAEIASVAERPLRPAVQVSASTQETSASTQ